GRDQNFARTLAGWRGIGHSGHPFLNCHSHWKTRTLSELDRPERGGVPNLWDAIRVSPQASGLQTDWNPQAPDLATGALDGTLSGPSHFRVDCTRTRRRHAS